MLKTRIFWGLMLLGFCSFAQGLKGDKLTMLVGTYTEGGNSEGIYSYKFNQEEGSFELLGSAAAGNPSFLTLSPNGKHLYAVSEFNDGRQGAYSFDLGKGLSHPVFQSTVIKTGVTDAGKQLGADPCHIYADDKLVLTANYTGGDVSVFGLDSEGRLKAGEQQFSFYGKSPQRVAHIHCIVSTPDKKYLLVTDLGNDYVYRFHYKRLLAGKEASEGVKVAYKTEDGQGPRHLTFSKDGRFAYLINELGGECVVLRYRNGKLKEVQRIMADEGGGRGSADIHISPDGRFLYTSHRLKKDGIAIFAIDPKKGTLTKVGYQHTGVHPRFFAISPNGKFLLVACRDDNKIQIFKRDETTGKLTDTLQAIEVEKPTCIVFTE